MPQPQPPRMPTPRTREPAVALMIECREYLIWEERRLSSILKCLRESPVDGVASPFEAAADGDAWDPGPGILHRERLKQLIAVVCGIQPSHSGLTILMGRLPPQEAASLQERRDTVRGLAQAVHSATRGWMRQVALLELGVECTLQELTGGRRLTVSYDDHGQLATGSLQPVINFRT
jgi:hypothetical protein